MNAREKGEMHVQAAESTLHFPGRRRYESDKANKAYFAGIVSEMAKKHPGKKVVQCQRDSTIFVAFVTDTFNYGNNGEKIAGEYIECPVCARRYFKEGDKYVSDRDLKFLS